MTYRRGLFSVIFVCAIAALPRAQELRRSGFVGVQVVAVSDTVRADADLPRDVGVVVQTLVEGGSAKASGLQPNDVITQVNDRIVTGVADFVQIARGLRDRDVPTLQVRRGRQTLRLDVPIRPRPFEQPADVNVLYDAVTVDTSLRRTIVTAPKQPGRHPAILYLNGIGCFSQESLDLTSNDARLLYGLARAGYVTMRVEKSGMGDSEGPSCSSPDADFRAEVRGYLAGLRALKRYAFVDADAVFLVGLSIGGVEAPLVAAEEHVRGVVVVNTVASPLYEYLLDTRRRQLGLAHTPSDDIDRQMLLDARCNQRLLVAKEKPDGILAAIPECRDYITYPAPYTFMQQWADVDVGAAWKAVDRPVLVVYGTSDFVSAIADDPHLVEVINAVHPGAATLRSIPGMDHALNKAASMAESFARVSAGEFEPAVLETLTSWMQTIK